MKLVNFSDCHGHTHQVHAKTLDGGVNSRLQDCVNAVDKIYAHARTIKADAVLFGGDMFQIKGSVSVPAFNLLFDLIRRKYADIQTIMIPGNHDMAAPDGSVHALEPFHGENVEVCDRVSLASNELGWTDVALVCIPFPMEHGKFSGKKFTENLQEAREMLAKVDPKCRILMTHAYTHELMGKYLGLPGDVSAADLAKEYDIALLGHHHIHEIIFDEATSHRVVSTGSPLQLTYNDRGFSRGFVVIDTDTMTIEFHALKMPKFFALEGEKTIDPTAVKGSFVRIKVKSKAEAERVETILKDAGAADWTIETLPKENKSRIDITGATGDDEILKKFLDSAYGATELDKTRLLEVGRKLLKTS